MSKENMSKEMEMMGKKTEVKWGKESRERRKIHVGESNTGRSME